MPPHAVGDLAELLGVRIDDGMAEPQDARELAQLGWDALQEVRERGGGRDAALGVLGALARDVGSPIDPDPDLPLLELLPRRSQRRRVWRELRRHVMIEPLRLPGWALALPTLPLLSLFAWLLSAFAFDIAQAIWAWSPFLLATIAIAAWLGRRWGTDLPPGLRTCGDVARRITGEPLDGLWTRERVERAVAVVLARARSEAAAGR